MKKILLILISLYTYSNAMMLGQWYVVNLQTGSSGYAESNSVYPCGSSDNVGKFLGVDTSDGITYTAIMPTEITGDQYNRPFTCRYNNVTFQLSSTPPLPSEPEKCLDNQEKINGKCVPKCGSNQTRDSSGNCMCPSGSATNPNVGNNVCYGAYDQDRADLSDGSSIIDFADGAQSFCKKDGTCLTYGANGDIIPNRFINPIVNADGSIKKDGYTPTAYKTFGWGEAAYDVLGKPVVNALGSVLQFAGQAIAFTATGGGYLVSNNPAINTLNPVANIGGAIFGIGSAMVSDDGKVVTVSPTSDKVNITLSDASLSFSSLDSSSAPADGTPVKNADGSTTQKITDSNYNNFWANAPGMGTVLKGAVGGTVTTPANSPDTAVVNTPDKLAVVKKSADGSLDAAVINKADLANTAKNKTDLPFNQQHFEPEKINNDGTKTLPSTSTPSIVSPTNNNRTNTNPVNGDTTTVKPTGNTATSNGNSTDLGVITSRLDGMSNQLTKLNNSADTANGHLSSIKSNTDGLSSALSSFNSKLAGANNSLADISSTLKGSEVSGQNHNIPSDTDGANWNTYSAAWDNLKSSFNDVTNKANDVKSLFQNGFKIDLPRGTVATCPYKASVDFGEFIVPYEFDLCSNASSLRVVFYTFFYMLFSSIILSFSIHSFIRLF